MAVNSVLAQSSMTIKYKDGIDLTGKDVIKAKKFSNIKVTADNQSILDTANALALLLQYEITDILRSDDNILVNA
ncbi:DUF1659 domain-containing protein [Candidatus Clostridium radicumherbarum]|uniref:DUF1659 domain-containing protein n=1 Tax=Candidatus Clostridium radicumherbarum TaxID=3381662 RepID=A0ABW8TRK1_9CLOT